MTSVGRDGVEYCGVLWVDFDREPQVRIAFVLLFGSILFSGQNVLVERPRAEFKAAGSWQVVGSMALLALLSPSTWNRIILE